MQIKLKTISERFWKRFDSRSIAGFVIYCHATHVRDASPTDDNLCICSSYEIKINLRRKLDH